MRNTGGGGEEKVRWNANSSAEAILGTYVTRDLVICSPAVTFDGVLPWVFIGMRTSLSRHLQGHIEINEDFLMRICSCRKYR
jgi:hypothetical protein